MESNFPLGLVNLGNTCFFNSVLQALMRTDELYYFYDQRYTKSKKKEAYYSNRFQKIIRKFHQSPNDALSPVSIIKSFENRHSYYDCSQQHDANQLLLLLIDDLHNDINTQAYTPFRSKYVLEDTFNTDVNLPWTRFLLSNQSIYVDLLHGSFISKLQCTECFNAFKALEPFVTLPLPIPTSPSSTTVSSLPSSAILAKLTVQFSQIHRPNTQVSFEMIEGAMLLKDLKERLSMELSLSPERLLFVQVSKQRGNDNEQSKQTTGRIQFVASDRMELDSYLLFQEIQQKGDILYLMEIDPTLAESVRKYSGRDTVQILESKGLFPVRLYIQRKIASVQRIFIVSESINFAILFFTLIESLRPLLQLPYPPQAKPSLKELRETAQNLPFKVQIRSSQSLWCPVCQIEQCDCSVTVKKEKLSNQYGCDYSIYLNFQQDSWLPGSLQDPSMIERFRIHNFVNPDMFSGIQNSSSSQSAQITLNECITLFNKTEQLSEENAWECQHCKRKVRALKTIQINRAPPILIIQLKRFHIQYTTEADKNEAFVAFPLDFFNPYKNQALINAVPSLDSVENDLTHLYECYAVINHYGSLHGGHYTAYVRVKGQKWYLFDDTQVSPVSSVSEIVNHNAYLLFYRRKDVALKYKEGAPMEQVIASIAQTLSKYKEETILKAEQELQYEKEGDEEVKEEVEFQYDSVLSQYLANEGNEQGKQEETQEDADLQLAKALQAMELSDQI